MRPQHARARLVYGEWLLREDRRDEAREHLRGAHSLLSMEELQALPVAALAAPDAHLYAWIGATRIPDVLRLVDAWGFEFVALLTWKKPSIGLGTWWR